MVSKKTSDSLGHALAVYFSEIENTQPLEPEEEVRLTKLVREGDKEALNKLINANLKFVVSVANKYRVTGIPLEDLINEGNIGLIKAAYRFDETRGFKFISYAVWWIRQSILQFISDKGRVVHLPANVANAVTKMKRRSEELEHSLERMPTMEELAEVMEITKQEAEKLVKFNTRSLSTDQPVGSDEKTSLRDLLQSDDSRPEAQIMKDSLTEEIKRVLKTIPDREAMIIECYFGIDMDRPLTLEEIGDSLELTRERVRQLKERAIRRLQHVTRAHLLRAFLG
ncbi:MAG TPA: sigma-70 family RNA polymerase sigma factor [Candidatus Marinimicrobia bacterium]|nr:sigma-70 family RNA polymerase sigma factor [Candidatus Neomarinimicrobiota bacterium]HIC73556.1 sigma-70 family RNA polymerase sigma factor [Candidatus Neomarinimicrobiota bacterium]HIO35823.1 sigma-70 family RNA polymerase sigma factor [Candidatus Neomarinimicrobiota bacterium]